MFELPFFHGNLESASTLFLLLAESEAHGSPNNPVESNAITMLIIAFVLVILNGFFVAAEFAMVKLRVSQIDKMVAEKKLFAKTTQWLGQRLDHTLSACQLGITMASLALGYVGEPAFAFLIEPLFKLVRIA